ncbi:MAG: acyl-CoA thioesterase [Proteobacteria bacterium]|nr:acyl-CoA thioesterase [Pseudomonadota bacterium]
MTDTPKVMAEVELAVPFHDVDMLEIAWHGHYCRYFEIARCAMLEKIAYDYMTMRATGFVWPVIDLHIRFVRPARFGQRIRVIAELAEYEYRMKIRYRVCDAESGTVLVRGHTIQVAVDARSGEMCYASPDIFLRKLGIVSP